ncbi:amino acid ABC transporter permease [Pseudomonas sp. JQ170]|uniref:amino acid ABC transporter permease n=1 Tax=unclassified Pseudomonas TaxID=196821 RepID=UPI00264BF1A2|nr:MULTISPECIES: amino acid ABC transporter permease [unclassified Pseudomonas]MDN7140941.1 amino acid ABC transporter permease [Pseudomonas sp. JQ170]WRO74960.1 amino acid ABC transporter permease [Pseudomonas sp. 170C]
MSFDLSIITDHLPDIASGFSITLVAWASGVVLALMLGLLVAMLQIFGGALLRGVLRIYVELIRSTPFLVQLFLLYYGGPSLGVELQPVTAGVIGLGIYGSVYFAEIFRSGFLSIPKSHLEAADCQGISRWTCMVRIEMPQMLVIILPALVNLITILCKETAVLSIITIPELTMIMTGIGSSTFAFVETLFVLGVSYLILIELCSRAGMWLEKRVGRFMIREVL